MLLDEEFSYRGGLLHCESVSLTEAAERFGTPLYVYSKRAIARNYLAYETALNGIAHQVCYAVKANSNLAVLQILARLGAGFDIVSGGELFRVLRAGAKPDRVVFSGVGKTAEEIRYALKAGIHSFNCESRPELDLISAVAVAEGRVASIALRVNPDVNALTHPYISTGLREHKFGTDIATVDEVYRYAASLPNIKPTGVSCHIGSQLTDFRPMLESADKVLALVDKLRGIGIDIRDLDLGGGLGVRYRVTDSNPSVTEYIAALLPKLNGRNLKLFLEPGRSIVANAGLLVTRVLLTKVNGSKKFVIVDGAMNDLVRPTLYQAHHEIAPVTESKSGMVEVDVVGPVCETGDFLARGRLLADVSEGELLAIQTAGAYGFVLASNYNSRPRVAEVLVDGESAYLARERETWQDLIRGEHLICD